ncbi:MAG: hypothetical protein DRO23_05150 [Thermoprotei archaeon]|nr:MAG: hypothetical protein DRO23_05150 [Thermoprotei archaeon]
MVVNMRKRGNRRNLMNGIANSIVFRRIVKWYSRKISSLMLKAGYYKSPIALITPKLVIAMTLLMLGSLTMALYTCMFKESVYIIYASLAMIFSGLFVFLSPILHLSLLTRDRRNGLRKELPYFLLYACVLQHAGVSFYTSLSKLAKSHIFKYLKKEAMVFLRDTRFLGKDPLSALDNLALNSPLKEFQDIIYGYTSLIKSGGDVAKYLEEKAKDLLKELKFKWKMYAERSVDVGESIASMFLMMVLLVLIGSIILPSDVLVIVVTLNFLVIPLIAIVSLILIDSLIPEIQETSRKYLKYLPVILTAAILCGWLSYNMLGNTSYALLTALLIFTLINGMLYYRDKKIINSIENALPEFLRDLTEYRKMGFTPSQAITRLAWSKNYNRYFNKLLNNMATHIKMGLGLSKLPRTNSWLFNYIVFILNEIEESGGGSPAILEELTHFINEIKYAKVEARKSLFLYELIAYLTPVLLTFSLALILRLVSSIFEVETYTALGSILELKLNFNEVFEQFKITIIEASLVFALLTSKIIDFTLRNTIRGFLILLIAGLSFILAPYVSEHIFAFISS